jgi:hypothetical protein
MTLPPPVRASVAAGGTLGVMATVRAIDVSAITLAAQAEQPPASIVDALELPKLVHTRGELGHPGGLVRQLDSSNAYTRGDPGLEG